MKKRELLQIILVVGGIFILLIGIMVGYQSLLGLFLEFSFNYPYGMIFMTLKILLGFLLLIPISVTAEAILKYKRNNNKVGLVLSEVIQFIPFFLIMHYSESILNLVNFKTSNAEFFFYLFMYVGLYLVASVGNLIKQEDQSVINNA